MTFGQLIGRDKLSPRLKRKVDSVKYSTSCLSLFFFATDPSTSSGHRLDLRGAGLDSGNFWFYDHPSTGSGQAPDVDKIYSDGLTDAVLRDETPPGMFLTATTLKDPSKMHSGHHTCESFAFVGYEAFEKWAHTKYSARPTDYDAMKEDPSTGSGQALRGEWSRKYIGMICAGWRSTSLGCLHRAQAQVSKHIVFYSLGKPLTASREQLSQHDARQFIRH